MERDEFLRRVRDLRDNYSDEIPQQILHSTMIIDGKPVNPKFKVRKGWFGGFYATVDEGIRLGYARGEGARLMKEFYDYDERTNFPKRLTTREDISRANEILTEIIKELESQMGLPGFEPGSRVP